LVLSVSQIRIIQIYVISYFRAFENYPLATPDWCLSQQVVEQLVNLGCLLQYSLIQILADANFCFCFVTTKEAPVISLSAGGCIFFRINILHEVFKSSFFLWLPYDAHWLGSNGTFYLNCRCFVRQLSIPFSCLVPRFKNVNLCFKNHLLLNIRYVMFVS
jgi:hypothetical protein